MNDSLNTSDACTGEDPRRRLLRGLLFKQAAGTGAAFVQLDLTVDQMLVELGWPYRSGELTAEIETILSGSSEHDPS